MKKIRYYYDELGHYIMVEVNEETAEFFEQERTEGRRRFWRERKRNDESYNYLEDEKGYQFRNSEPDNPLEILILKEEPPKEFLPVGNTLTPKQRLVLELHYQQGLHIATIANELGISRTAVNKLLKKGLKKLREGFTNWQ